MVARKTTNWLAVLLFSTHVYGDVLGDRIIMDIGGNSFTQRQLEAHILVRESLRQRGVRGNIFSPQHWQQHLQIFLDDMLILAKIERYKWYPLTNAEIDAALKKSEHNLGANNADLVRLGINSNMLKNLVANNLKIKTYRNNQAGVEDELVRLREKNYMRFYTGSSVFQEIHPQ